VTLRFAVSGAEPICPLGRPRRHTPFVEDGAMSQYFKIGDLTLWNPSNGVAALFMRSAEALAPAPLGSTRVRDADRWAALTAEHARAMPR
jgi:hypothetical protein